MVYVFRSLILSLFLFLPVSACAQEDRTGNTTPLYFDTADGRTVEFHVEVADTPSDRARGLMHREEMPEKHGMVFLFEDVSERSFWMKNTLMPLDIIFLDPEYKVLSIQKGVPLNEVPVSSGGLSSHAIELNQGTARKFGIKLGDQVRFMFF